jgi:hypothetical protein
MSQNPRFVDTDGDDSRVEIDFGVRPHLYEAYWAPLTEGAIGLWQTIRFLLSGGWNGLRSDAQLRRFMFDRLRVFRISRWALVALAVAAHTEFWNNELLFFFPLCLHARNAGVLAG